MVVAVAMVAAVSVVAVLVVVVTEQAMVAAENTEVGGEAVMMELAVMVLAA